MKISALSFTMSVGNFTEEYNLLYETARKRVNHCIV
jgi:hypothetical protein